MDIFIGTVSAMGFNYAPYGWMQCSGQILPIQSYTALFALIGTAYGGNGTTNFGLPNLQGRVANCQGQSGQTSNYQMGEIGGASTVTLNSSNLPPHNHSVSFAMNCNNTAGLAGVTNPIGAWPANSGQLVYNASAGTTPVVLATPTVTLANSGGTVPIGIQDPVLVMNYCIALQGVFPARN